MEPIDDILDLAGRLAQRFGDEAFYAAVCIRAGVVGPELPHRIAQMLLSIERYGMLGGAVALAGIRHRDQLAVIDEAGELTWGELDQRVNSVAAAWTAAGFEAGDGVAILARNHRGILEAIFAGAKLGGKIILLNTGFSGPQIKEVADREGVDLLVHDEEFGKAIGDFSPRLGRIRSWAETRTNDDDTLEAQIAAHPPKAPGRPKQSPKLIILTSGTTGTPKGAGRGVPMSLSPIGGPLSRVPYRAREVTQLCAPVFHALGLSQMILGVALGSTLVLQRKFDPREVLDSLEQNKASTMVMVPVMLQRVLALDDDAWAEREFPDLRIIFVSGSALSTDVAERATERFGPVVYNLYGSTEIAYATIATPDDFAHAPGSVGKVVHGAVVKIFDDDGNEVPADTTGRIFVANAIQFEGYTGGGDKDRIDGMMSSGDVGHFDSEGRLFIDGRDDEMIVSGGENVFPQEVEELIGRHDAVDEVAVIGVDDDDYGQRLKAFVVLRDGASLSEDDVRGHVKENLANYKVPREVVFLDELPRNQTGKVLKRELAGDGEDS